VSIDHEDHSKTDDLEWSKIMHDEKTTANRRADEAAVRDLYQELMDGWNRGSGEAFAAAFAHDGDLVAFDGTHFEGREEIAPFHQQLFDKWLKGSRLVGRVEEVRFLSPDVAVMHAVGSTVMRGKTEPSPERDSIQTLVATRESGEWRIAAFQNTRVRPMGPNPIAFVLWALTDLLWKVFRPNKKDTRVSPYRKGDHIRSVA
jgi:uncharacterized protein (TIGR02246 family)